MTLNSHEQPAEQRCECECEHRDGKCGEDEPEKERMPLP